MVEKITKTLYIQDREDWYFHFLNSRWNRKNDRLFFKEYEIREDLIILKWVKTLERHFLWKPRNEWQCRDEVIVNKKTLKRESATRLYWWVRN